MFARGDEVHVTGSMAPRYRFWNDGLGDPRPSSARRGVVLSGAAEDVVVVREGSGVLWAIDRARACVRRRIAASLIKVGSHRMGVDEFRLIALSGKVGQAAQVAPAHGLCLMKVNYSDFGSDV